ncbi:MAG: hypothetical protein NT096_00230 [Proteobacteria bacterium]|nr:hypothetical protein [Pseudomonadota bacterium]
MQIGSWWAITEGTLTGPWHVTSKGSVWYIINMLTLTIKNIGPVRGHGLNYCTRAKEIARERNAKFLKENKEKLPMYLGRYPEFDKTIVEVLTSGA